MPNHDVSSLTALAIRGLRRMQLPDGLFCLERVRGVPGEQGRSVRYSLMTYLGLVKAEQAGLDHGFDLDAIRDAMWKELDSDELLPGDFGLYLWADGAWSPGGDGVELIARAERAFAARGGLSTRECQEVAWVILGLVRHSAARETDAGARLLRAALDDLISRREPSGLLAHYAGRKARRRFANFADQIYGTLGLATAATEGVDDRALGHACAVADRLIELQLADGGWPWFYDARRGQVIERYGLFSVHQHAMAPMGLLQLAEASGERRYVDAAQRGLTWIHGANELGLDMVDGAEEFIYRGIRRKRGFRQAIRSVNAVTSIALGRSAVLQGTQTKLDATCRPYELGWLLEAWCGREHLIGSATAASASAEA